MPAETPMQPYPYKNTDGIIATTQGDIPDPFIVNNLQVNGGLTLGNSTQFGMGVNVNESIYGNLVVYGTITGTFSGASTAAHFIATDGIDQYRVHNTMDSSFDFKHVDSATPVFNFKNSGDQTNESILNAGNFYGSTTSTAGAYTKQTNTTAGTGAEAGFRSVNDTGTTVDIVMTSSTNTNAKKGVIRTSSDAFGLDIITQGLAKNIRLMTDSEERVTIEDGGLVTDFPITSTYADGPPFLVVSSDQVSNLNVSELEGATWEKPLSIGSTTANSGYFTNLNSSVLLTADSLVVTTDSTFGGAVTIAGILTVEGNVLIPTGTLEVGIGGITVAAGGIDIVLGGLTVQAGVVALGIGGVVIGAGGLAVTLGGIAVAGGSISATLGDVSGLNIVAQELAGIGGTVNATGSQNPDHTQYITFVDGALQASYGGLSVALDAKIGGSIYTQNGFIGTYITLAGSTNSVNASGHIISTSTGNPTSSTDNTNSAIYTAGGMAIVKDLYVGGIIHGVTGSSGSLELTNTTGNNLKCDSSSDATSTSTTTASIYTLGGIAVTKTVWANQINSVVGVNGGNPGPFSSGATQGLFAGGGLYATALTPTNTSPTAGSKISIGPQGGSNDVYIETFSFDDSTYSTLHFTGPSGGNVMMTMQPSTIGIGGAPTSSTYQLDVQSSNTTDTVQVHNTNAGGFATIKFQNDTGTVAFFGIGGSGSSTPYANKLYCTSNLFVYGTLSGTQLISTISSGTPPLAVASNTNIPNLNASLLNGNTFANPGPIGATPSNATFTSTVINGGVSTINHGLETVGNPGPMWYPVDVGVYTSGISISQNTGTSGSMLSLGGSSGSDDVYIESSNFAQTMGARFNITGPASLGAPTYFQMTPNVSPSLTTNNFTGSVAASTSISGNTVVSGSTVTGTILVSTVASGTAPLTIASNTVIPNLNASLLNGQTFANPGTIGGTTPSSATFTNLTVNNGGTSPYGLITVGNPGSLWYTPIAGIYTNNLAISQQTTTGSSLSIGTDNTNNNIYFESSNHAGNGGGNFYWTGPSGSPTYLNFNFDALTGALSSTTFSGNVNIVGALVVSGGITGTTSYTGVTAPFMNLTNTTANVLSMQSTATSASATDTTASMYTLGGISVAKQSSAYNVVATTSVSSSTMVASSTITGLVLVSTIASGTAPFTVASNTVVANLNASYLNGTTFQAPGSIGGVTPSDGTFTTVLVNGGVTTLNHGLLTVGNPGQMWYGSPTSGAWVSQLNISQRSTLSGNGAQMQIQAISSDDVYFESSNYAGGTSATFHFTGPSGTPELLKLEPSGLVTVTNLRVYTSSAASVQTLDSTGGTSGWASYTTYVNSSGNMYVGMDGTGLNGTTGRGVIQITGANPLDIFCNGSGVAEFTSSSLTVYQPATFNSGITVNGSSTFTGSVTVNYTTTSGSGYSPYLTILNPAALSASIWPAIWLGETTANGHTAEIGYNTLVGSGQLTLGIKGSTPVYINSSGQVLAPILSAQTYYNTDTSYNGNPIQNVAPKTGTWTPIITGQSGTYSGTPFGKYTAIGGFYTFYVFVAFNYSTTSTNSNNITLQTSSGPPFPLNEVAGFSVNEYAMSFPGISGNYSGGYNGAGSWFFYSGSGAAITFGNTAGASNTIVIAGTFTMST